MYVVFIKKKNKKNMGTPDLGPKWFWTLLFILAGCGLIGVIGMFIYFVVCLYNHIQII